MANVRARSAFYAGRRVIHANDILDSNDPMVKQFPSKFETLDGEPVKKSRSRKAATPKADESDEPDESTDD